MKPEIGTVLRSDDGVSIVVAEGTAPLDALLMLIEEEYGGPRFSADNPAIVAALDGLKVEAWRECSPELQEAEGVGEDDDTSWWASFGDGPEVIHVLFFDGYAYGLGEEAEAAELEPAAGERS